MNGFPAEAGDVQPCLREGRLRPRDGRDAARRGRARHHRPRAHGAAQPRAPRRDRLGCRHRRRRRHPDADAGCLPARGRRLRAAAGGGVRRRHGVPARATTTPAPRRRPASSRSPHPRTSSCSAGATCPPPTRTSASSPSTARPVFEQLFVSRPAVGDAPALSGIALDRRTFRLRKRARTELDAYFVSLSARTLGYKGMVTTLQLEPFYPDLQDERFASELAVVHSRYSTNTFPSWPLAQPLRMLAHNGEINTVNGNRNWMRARQSQLESELLGDLAPVLPICTDGRERLGVVRRGARAADPHRPQPAARDHDDGPRGVREAGRHRPEAARVLRVPLDADGAVGRPGRAHLHRRHARRRDPRPQRPAPRPLDRDHRRPHRDRQRDRRARLRARAHQAPRAPAPRPHVPRRHRAAPHHRGRRDQGAARRPGAVAGVARRGPRAPGRPARARAHRAPDRLDHPPPAHVRLHRGGGPHPPDPDGPDRRRAARRDGQRHARRRAQRAPAPAVRLLHAAVRAGDEPAAGLDPRRGRHLARARPRTRAQPAVVGCRTTRAS